jgi:hypothetical protein
MAGPLALLALLPLQAAPAPLVHEASKLVAQRGTAPPRSPQAPSSSPPAIPLRTLPPAPGGPALAWRDGRGDGVTVNGMPQRAQWLIERGELWLPLELLEGQLGASRGRAGPDGLTLEWFGQRLSVPTDRQRSLADEVAVPVSGLLRSLGVSATVRGRALELDLPPPELLAIRTRDLGSAGRRVVFDLAGPGLLRSGDGRLLLGVQVSTAQRQELETLGLGPSQQGSWLALRADGRHLSLDQPWRLVLDLPAAGGEGTTGALQRPAAPDPRLAQLMAQGLTIDRRVAAIGGERVLIHSVRLDPRRVPLELRPLNRPDGMQGLSSLSDLARREQALIAINGGYFNRINRLPLGALRDGGIWLSGPILNRGAVGWTSGDLPRFGRLSLEEILIDGSGRRWPVASLNSGYVQRGIARYTAAWGRSYQPITAEEMAVLLRHGQVVQRFEPGGLSGGVPLGPDEELVVARGGLELPWQPGERLLLHSRPNHGLGLSPHVIGGGPLLLQDGKLVLNGTAEGFSSGFLRQGAPRTVIASDGRELWLLTLQGVSGPGPTLLETALLLQQQGLRDALNLDGGSSTGLVLGQEHAVKGRGVAAAVHNGLGLVPRQELRSVRGDAASALASGP